MSDQETISWFDEHYCELYILFSHNFVDFNDKSDYIKRSAMLSYIDNFSVFKKREIVVRTNVH